MPATVVNLYQAKTTLPHLVDRAAAGEEILIAQAGGPVAKPMPLDLAPDRLAPGGWEGKVRIARDFDTPLPGAVFDG